MDATVYLGLGSNLGDKKELLLAAVTQIQQTIGRVISLSSFYETPPWGFSSPHTFLNGAVGVVTRLSPESLLAATQQIERELGRTTKTGSIYQDRSIDVDILFYDNRIIDIPNLHIPHPLLQDRDFVLLPLQEIAPEMVHPVLQKTIKELYVSLHQNKK